MDYRIARNANVILGVCSVGLEAYAFHDSLVYREFEKFFLGVTSFFILEAIFFSIWYADKPKKNWEMIWRMTSSLILVSCGGYLIWSTIDIQDTYCKVFRECQPFEIKLVAASLTITNAIFYVLARPRGRDSTGGVVHGHPASASPAIYPPLPGYQAQYVHSTGPQGASVFVVPRAYLNQPMSTASNYNPTPSVGYNNSQQYLSVYPTLPTYQHSTIQNS